MIVNAEQALIGALMMEPRAIKDCRSIRPDMFVDALLGRIYLEFLRAHDFGYQANLVTLAANITDVSQSELLSKLKACSDSSVTSMATGEYAEVIKNTYKARTATQIINAVQFHPSAVEKQIGETVNALEALQEDDRPKAKSLSEIVDEMAPGCFVDRERDFLYTGFPRLDDCLGGLEGGDIIVIGARPAVGKSAFVTQILTNMGIQGKRVLLCAGDTFRAAAADQLEIWANRAHCELVRQKEGADPGAVLFDAIQAAKARGVDVVICDTAGRLHNKANLMAELHKLRKIIDRELPEAAVETLLVLDATTGQNGLIQAKQFQETAGCSGIVLTKLDGTAKGGIVVAIAQELQVPVKFVGLGEGIDDMQPFDAKEYVSALI